jgi:tRNA1(Val) A37 N6-methylase TrmN6
MTPADQEENRNTSASRNFVLDTRAGAREGKNIKEQRNGVGSSSSLQLLFSSVASQMQGRIAIIGCGNMALSLLRGLLKVIASHVATPELK